MADSKLKILVLGAYSAVGKSIVRGLLDETDCVVRATGRQPAKLDAFQAKMAHPRLTCALLDALDRPALEQACREADLVVNCVGPYIMSGREIAATVVAAGKHYLDFAFEQFHYRKLGELDAAAKTKGAVLVTGAGEAVGLSSVVAAAAAERLGRLERVSIYALMGREEDAETGFSSFINGVLEPALGNLDFIDGRYVNIPMGADTPEHDFPAPFGRSRLISDPSIDCLILPEKLGCRTVRNYFGLGMSAPAGFFPLMRLLNPYKRRLFYRLTGRIVRGLMRQNHEQKVRDNVPEVQLLVVEAAGNGKRIDFTFHFQNDFNCTAYLPVIICKQLAAGEIAPRGLCTALDLVTPVRLFQELEGHRSAGRLAWSIGEPSPEEERE